MIEHRSEVEEGRVDVRRGVSGVLVIRCRGKGRVGVMEVCVGRVGRGWGWRGREGA